MFPFFGNKKKTIDKYGDDSIISSKDLLNDEEMPSDEEVETTLSLHPDWEISAEDQYVYQFLNNDLPKLKANQISLSGIELNQDDKGVYVTAFIRNALNRSIKFEETTLVLLGKNGERLASGKFNLEKVGEIPARSSRPWQFFFLKELFADDALIPEEGFKLAFELRPSSRRHQLDLSESWQQSLADEAKERLEQIVESLTPPKAGEVNFMGLQASIEENGNLNIVLLIRNGNDRDISLEQLPLAVEDATGEMVAKGNFTFENFTIHANTSKPWSFIFPTSLILKETIDLSSWKVYPYTQK